MCVCKWKPLKKAHVCLFFVAPFTVKLFYYPYHWECFIFKVRIVHLSLMKDLSKNRRRVLRLNIYTTYTLRWIYKTPLSMINNDKSLTNEFPPFHFTIIMIRYHVVNGKFILWIIVSTKKKEMGWQPTHANFRNLFSHLLT